ncbi:MAG: enoyl-CoA hydratase/isomerase family protein [Actinomycetota bacterium]|nr:enoyl-CoA hydratase/isomerase family protein [Actinomycetota bacterium]
MNRPAASGAAGGAAGVAVAVHGSVGSITLDRAAKRNALTYDMWVALGEACSRLAADPQVRVVVLRGAGDHFCAGADITELLAPRPAHAPSFMDVNMTAEHALATLAKPTIALVQGDCIGGGAALAIDCDLRIAVAGARFGISPAKLGIVYPAASLERAVRLLGPAAKRLLYTAELIDATEAHRIGLVDELLPADAVDARVAQLCAMLAERSLLTQAATKEMIAATLEHGAVPAALADRWAREVAVAADPEEGVAAFSERRAPRFSWNHSAQS